MSPPGHIRTAIILTKPRPRGKLRRVEPSRPAAAGVPATIDFAAPVTVVVHFRLSNGSGGGFDPTAATIQHAVSIEVVVPKEPEEEPPPEAGTA